MSNNGHNDERYHVEFLPVHEIYPSPENEELYGPVLYDNAPFEQLKKSIAQIGLEEPITVTADRYILSGHRRHLACEILGFKALPCKMKRDILRAETPSDVLPQ